EERVPTITAAANPDLIYDYYGFPPESYQIQYPAPGEPELAGKVQQALASAGINSQLSDTRGYDHGVFIPLKIMYPDADIPCIQLSLNHNLNAEDHLAMGKALQALDYDNLLILGSGFSFHNMRAFFAPNTPEIRARNQAFEDWLLETCASTEMTEADRSDRFANWERAPEARFCHPREEHLLPLHVCYGWAGKAADKHWTANILNKNSGMFYWQV
ncbi:MAG: DODA-type extradiol aromatic ring-opening family dioxygenase, partial [Oceanobacter sp.]